MTTSWMMHSARVRGRRTRDFSMEVGGCGWNFNGFLMNKLCKMETKTSQNWMLCNISGDSQHQPEITAITIWMKSMKTMKSMRGHETWKCLEKLI